ncbi:MAG TPA: RNA-binding S4 domain-containing protein [Burkholderiales bacterium]|nr:RNA-binding S4 domain-containing protein [Burkholderiales bacterium]
MRLDKWLWAARFFKTRSLAQKAIEAGQVRLRGERVKPAHELKAGDELFLRKSELEWTVLVRRLSERRGPAAEAATLYEETAASRAERERRLGERRWNAEPGAAIKGRPTKRDRRRLDALTGPEGER